MEMEMEMEMTFFMDDDGSWMTEGNCRMNVSYFCCVFAFLAIEIGDWKCN